MTTLVRSLLTTLFATTLTLGASPVFAHHSLVGEFDTETFFELEGTLTKLEWTNPHLWYYLDVAGKNGETEKWQCTTGTNPNRLLRAGWKKEDLPVGTVVHIARANPARADARTCFVSGNLTLKDGTPIFSGTRDGNNNRP